MQDVRNDFPRRYPSSPFNPILLEDQSKVNLEASSFIAQEIFVQRSEENLNLSSNDFPLIKRQRDHQFFNEMLGLSIFRNDMTNSFIYES